METQQTTTTPALDLPTIVGDHLDPIAEITALLLNPETASQLDALEIAAMLKRAENALNTVRVNLLPFANARFQALQLAEPEKKQHAVGNGAALVSRYASRAVWTYPADITKMAVDLKASQKAAQLNNSATKQTPTPDPEKKALFAITLL